MGEKQNTDYILGYGIKDCGNLLFRIFDTKKEAIEWGKNYYGASWENVKADKTVEIVKVKMHVDEWEW